MIPLVQTQRLACCGRYDAFVGQYKRDSDTFMSKLHCLIGLLTFTGVILSSVFIMHVIQSRKQGGKLQFARKHWSSIFVES
jgi:hypothetical protein